MGEIPCEHIVWNVLPAIRKEFAKSLMSNYNLNQKQVASILGLTPAAVSQYLSNKRGGISITDDSILHEIDESVRIIFENKTVQLASEICRICNLLRSIKLVSANIGCCKGSETSCETAVWHILPIIRKELAKNLIENYKFSQRKVADILGLTETAVSRYLSGKRGNLEIFDNKILKEIQKSTSRIVEKDGTNVSAEICRICVLLKFS